ncbi:MAG: hypothetical protein R3A13_03890 [Bdellovibrionota bacterium]
MPPALALRNPLAFISAEFFHLVSHRIKSKTGAYLGGPNHVVRIGSYAQVNGYNPTMRSAEDDDFDKKISILRQGANLRSAHRYSNVRTRIFTDPRRGEAACQSGAYGLQWQNPNTSFDVHNPNIRKQKPRTHSPLSEQLEDPDFEKKLQAHLNQTLKIWRNSEIITQLSE